MSIQEEWATSLEYLLHMYPLNKGRCFSSESKISLLHKACDYQAENDKNKIFLASLMKAFNFAQNWSKTIYCVRP